jgi:hypothetical protein
MAKMIILATCGNGYCGCDDEEVFIFEEEVEASVIDEEVLAWAENNAESFAHVHFGWDEEYTDEEYEEYMSEYLTYDWQEASYEDFVKWCENWGYEPENYIKEGV